MNNFIRTGWVRILSALVFALLVFPSVVCGADFSVVRSAETELLTIRFDEPAPSSSLRRTGRTRMILGLPSGSLANSPVLNKSFPSSRIIQEVKVRNNGLEISLRTDAFGYIKLPGDGQSIVIQYFGDPVGARWQPATAPRPKKTVAKRKPPRKKVAQPKVQPAEKQPDKPVAEKAAIPKVEPRPEREVIEVGTSEPVLKRSLPVDAVVYSLGTATENSTDLASKVENFTPLDGEDGQNSIVLEGQQPNSIKAPVQFGGPEGAKRYSGPDPALAERAAARRTDQEGIRAAVTQPVPQTSVADNTSSQSNTVQSPVSQQDEQPLRVLPEPVVKSVELGGEPAATPQTDVPSSAESSQPVQQDVGRPTEEQLASDSEGMGAARPVDSAAVGTIPDVSPTNGTEVDPYDGLHATRRDVVFKTLEQLNREEEMGLQTDSGGVSEGVIDAVRRSVESVDALGQDITADIEKGTDQAQPGPEAVAMQEPVKQEPLQQSLAEEPGEADIASEEKALAEQSKEEELASADNIPAEEFAEGPTEYVPGNMTTLMRRAGQEDALYQAETAMETGDNEGALDILETLANNPKIYPDIKENALYTLASLQFILNQDNLRDNYMDVTGGFERAMNFNSSSPRVSEALLNLGLVNLKVDNIPEAGAYFTLLKKNYPYDDNIPFIDYYWGDYYYNKGDYQKAADRFQSLVQTYPDSKVVREASLGLARSLDILGYEDQSWQIVDYIKKRWPRYYVESPSFLALTGNIANKLNKFEEAKDAYWTYYNLTPEAPNMDVIMARIGDIYIRENQKKAAGEMYRFVAANYPDTEGGLVSKMRLAEEGIYDDPTQETMATVFDRPYNKRPVDIYTEIVKRYPQSALAPLAQLKLAMWYMWNGKDDKAVEAADDFLKLFPKNSLVPRATEVGLGAFEKGVAGFIEQGNYPRILSMWQEHPFLVENSDKLTRDTLMAVAVSYWKRGYPDKALEMARAYYTDEYVPKLSDMAVNLAFNVFIERSAWGDIIDLAEQVKDWPLDREQKKEILYAQALSMINLGRLEGSRPLWAQLAADFDLSPDRRAYAMYYLAKFAEQDDDLEKEFLYAQEALAFFMTSSQDKERIKELMVMIVDVTLRAGRLQDALRWATEYDSLVSVDDPDWAAARFQLASIYKELGSVEEWKETLKSVIDERPGTIYARSAQSAIDAYDLEQQLQQYSASSP